MASCTYILLLLNHADDHSRVVLSVKDTDPAGSDFINASHMEVSL